MSPVDAYLAALTQRLRGPRVLVTDLLAEVGDGLRDATEAYLRCGLPPALAESRAVSEFGSVDELAPAFQRELALVQGRRTALKLAVVLPLAVFLSGLAWQYLLPVPAPGASVSPPPDYRTAAWMVALFGFGSGGFFLLAWLILGPGARLLPLPEWIPRVLGRVAVILVSTLLLAGAALVVISSFWAPWALLSSAMLINVVIWVLCFTQAIRSTRRCLRTALA